MRFFTILPLAAGLLGPVRALEVAGPLTLVPSATNVNRFNVNVTASIASGSSTSNATGAVNVRLKVDPATGKVSALTFEGGRLSFSNMTITLRALFFVTAATLTTSGLQGYPWTAAPPAPVNPPDGNFEASLHGFTLDKGTVNGTTAIAIGDLPAGTTFAEDFAKTPVSGPGEGTGNVTLVDVPALATASTRTWKTTLSLPLNILQTIDLDGTPVTIRLTGTIRAESNLAIPRSDYYAWTITHSLPAPAFASAVRPGEAYGMVWAMGLQPSQSLGPYLPRITTTTGGPQALLSLPSGGTVAPLIIEVSDRLTAGSWAPAAAASITGGTNPLLPGTAGAVSVRLSGPNQFVRLRANPP